MRKIYPLLMVQSIILPASILMFTLHQASSNCRPMIYQYMNIINHKLVLTPDILGHSARSNQRSWAQPGPGRPFLAVLEPSWKHKWISHEKWWFHPQKCWYVVKTYQDWDCTRKNGRYLNLGLHRQQLHGNVIRRSWMASFFSFGGGGCLQNGASL